MMIVSDLRARTNGNTFRG